MILGKIIYASPEKHFFHIHSYYTDNDKWQKGLVFSTKEFNRIGSITNPLKKIKRLNLKGLETNYIIICHLDIHAFSYLIL